MFSSIHPELPDHLFLKLVATIFSLGKKLKSGWPKRKKALLKFIESAKPELKNLGSPKKDAFLNSLFLNFTFKKSAFLEKYELLKIEFLLNWQ